MGTSLRIEVGNLQVDKNHASLEFLFKFLSDNTLNLIMLKIFKATTSSGIFGKNSVVPLKPNKVNRTGESKPRLVMFTKLIR